MKTWHASEPTVNKMALELCISIRGLILSIETLGGMWNKPRYTAFVLPAIESFCP